MKASSCCYPVSTGVLVSADDEREREGEGEGEGIIEQNKRRKTTLFWIYSDTHLVPELGRLNHTPSANGSIKFAVRRHRLTAANPKSEDLAIRVQRHRKPFQI